ncbi:BTAD domain-containing putative transcriptional regulator [Amycolatopsis sp. cg5]|uniref:AfsR/SARP family transcriptional regulator n=1 Tax=Amycolatopsis sp. cg5 TaxID=3238802 RepID=UPI003524BD9F
MELQFRVLGAAEVTVDGRPVPLGGSRPLIVLAGLLLRPNQVVSVEELSRWLWDDDDQRRSKGALQTYVLRVRRALGELAPIRTERGGYLIEVDEATLDLTRFRDFAARGKRAAARGELRQAASLFADALAQWRGQAMSNVESDALHRDEIAQLAEERLRVREQWAEAMLALGDYVTVIPELADLTRENPLRERLHEQLMIALYRAGRQAEALTVYREISAVLAEELGLDPGASLQRAHQAILTGDETARVAISADLAAYRLGSEPLIPRQLPADLGAFAGREADLKALWALVPEQPSEGTASSPIASIEGMGGIGKTTLAVHFAHDVADRFPGGQLYANLRGYGPGDPVEPAAALETMLASLGVPADRIPSDLDGRASLWRTHSAGRRLLILLDNAAGTEQVRLLLPGPGCLVLVTSRWQLRTLVARHSAHRVALDELAEQDAITLLAATIGVERAKAECAATERFVDYCGRLPLAIRILAVRADQFPEVPLADFLDDLDTEHDRLGSFDLADGDETNIRAVFSHSYQALDPAAARMLRLLSLPTGADFSAPAAAAIAGVDLASARTSLNRLASAYLLGQPRPGRYQFHDLIRVYAAELSSRFDCEATRAAAIDRLLDWYLSSALNASKILRPERHYRLVGEVDGGSQFGCHEQALDWFDEEEANLVAAVSFAFREERYERCWQLAWVLQSAFIIRARLDEWRSVFDLALRAARLAKNRAGEAGILSGLGVAHGVARQHADSLRYLRQVLEIQRELGAREGEARAQYNLALSAGNNGDQERAYGHALEALRLVRELNLGNLEPDVLQALGDISAEMGDHAKALELADSALAIWRRAGIVEDERFALHSRGKALVGLGRTAEGIGCMRQAVDMFFSRGESYEAADVLAQLGDIHLRLGDGPSARDCWLRAVRVLTELSHPAAEDVRAKLGGLVASFGPPAH